MGRPYAIYICGGDEMCAPCRANVHEQCSWDGEPDCLCSACPKSRKKANRKALEEEMSSSHG